MQKLWTQSQALSILAELAEDVATFFRVPAPQVIKCPYHSGKEWEYRIGEGFGFEVWTKAGRAEMNITVSARFAHRYFRFAEPDRAKGFDVPGVSLNPYSGKWNRIAAAPDDLTVFRAYNRNDFRRVAEPNPNPDEVAVYREKEEARRAAWAAVLMESN
jgi:hypothetical protein